jgi:Activator of Hsp90 ATPase homolog 1-like protein
MSEATGQDELIYRRIHDAPRELLFDCMTTPEHLTHFWGAAGTTTPIEDITVDLRPGGVFETVMVQHWTPPGGGYHGALNHVVIHGLDVTVPLGVPRRSPDETIRIVLDDLIREGGHAHFGMDIDGRYLAATDLDWSYGSGAPLRGSAGELAVALCGRAVPAGRLDGEPLRPADPAP